MKIPKWEHKLVWNYKRGKLVSFFLNNASKTLLYKFQRTLKLSMFFSLTHFYISLEISTQVALASLRNTFENNMSSDIKFSRAQISKINQSGGFLGALLSKIMVH